METKGEIKTYIIREYERVKDFPDLNYPPNWTQEACIQEMANINMSCYQYGKRLSKVWNQEDIRIYENMPDVISDLVLKLKSNYDIDVRGNISEFVEYYTKWCNLNEIMGSGYLFPVYILSQIHKECNGYVFSSISYKDFETSVMNPDKRLGKIQINNGKKNYMYYVIKKLNKISADGWENIFIESIGLEYSNYSKKLNALNNEDSSEYGRNFAKAIDAIFLEND